MNINIDTTRAANYTNPSQIARVLTEDWVKAHGYCPNCGEIPLQQFANNKPVADFYCKTCSEQFELKSKNGTHVGKKIVDGAYSTMIERINSDENPNFFFLTYNKTTWQVSNFLIIPKHFFVPDMIEKRNPLGVNARRAGWIGCNINLARIPESGRIFFIRNSGVISKQSVQSKWKGTTFLKAKKGEAKGWVLDVMNCVDAIPGDTFSLQDMYAFEGQLQAKHPTNNFIKDKIRQQLQLLRDKGFIEFHARGSYRKLNYENI